MLAIQEDNSYHSHMKKNKGKSSQIMVSIKCDQICEKDIYMYPIFQLQGYVANSTCDCPTALKFGSRTVLSLHL